MRTLLDTTTARRHAPGPAATLARDLAALGAVREHPEDGAVSPRAGPWREGIVRLLDGALAAERVCVLRYRRHHFTAAGLASPRIAEELLAHAREEAAHADRIAGRIVQLGGTPGAQVARSHADADDGLDLKALIRADLVAERVAIEAYGHMLQLVGDTDPTTRRLLEDLLADEQKHADTLEGWLGD